MTALENVAVSRELAGESDAFERARGELAAVGLGHRLESLSRRAVRGESNSAPPSPAHWSTARRVLLADEPTGNLDAATGEQVMDHLLARGRDEGASLVLITHEARLASLCDRSVRMMDGRIESLR